MPGGKSGRDCCRHEAVVAVKFRGSDALHQVHQVLHLYHLAVRRAHVYGLEVGRVVALLAVYLAHYLVLLSVEVEVTHTLAAEAVLQGLCYVLGGDAHEVGLLAVHAQAHLGFGELQVHVGHLEDGVVIHLGHELGQDLFQFLYGGGLKNVLHGHGAASSAEGALLLHEGTRVGLLAYGLAEFVRHFHLCVVALGQVPECNLYVAATVRHTCCDELGIGHERVGQTVDVLGVVAHVFIGHALGAHGTDGYARAVLQRSHFGRHVHPHCHTGGKGNRHQGDCHPAAAQEGAEPT